MFFENKTKKINLFHSFPHPLLSSSANNSSSNSNKYGDMMLEYMREPLKTSHKPPTTNSLKNESLRREKHDYGTLRQEQVRKSGGRIKIDARKVKR